MFLDDALRRIIHDELRAVLREELANLLPRAQPQPTRTNDPNALLTVDDVAERCGVRVTTVRTWIKDGALAALRLSGRHYRMREADVEAFLSKQGGGAAAAGADVNASVERVLAKMHSKRA